MRFTPRHRPEVIAHRGACLERPENTLDAFALAVEQGADTVELDLRATRDGHAVVLHDPTLERTHGDPRAVAALPLAALPASVPTLTQVLSAFAGEVRLLLELKGPAAPVHAVVPLAAGLPGVVLQSFDRPALRRALRAEPRLAVAPLFGARPTSRQLDRAARGAEGVGVPHELVDAGLARAVHGRGLRLRAFTANEPSELARLHACGVDGLITDAPAAALRVLAARGAEAA